MSSISNGIYERPAVNRRDHVRRAQPHPWNVANTRIGGISFERGVRQTATVARTAPCASDQTHTGFGGNPSERRQPDRQASRFPGTHAAAGPCAGQPRARTSARPSTEVGRQAFPGNRPDHRCGPASEACAADALPASPSDAAAGCPAAEARQRGRSIGPLMPVPHFRRHGFRKDCPVGPAGEWRY